MPLHCAKHVSLLYFKWNHSVLWLFYFFFSNIPVYPLVHLLKPLSINLCTGVCTYKEAREWIFFFFHLLLYLHRMLTFPTESFCLLLWPIQNEYLYIWLSRILHICKIVYVCVWVFVYKTLYIYITYI